MKWERRLEEIVIPRRSILCSLAHGVATLVAWHHDLKIQCTVLLQWLAVKGRGIIEETDERRQVQQALYTWKQVDIGTGKPRATRSHSFLLDSMGPLMAYVNIYVMLPICNN